MRIKEIDTDKLKEIVAQSDTFAKILKQLELTSKGSGNYRTLQDRLKKDNIDFSHISRGHGHRKGKPSSFIRQIPLEEILIENSTYKNIPRLKSRLIKSGLCKDRCLECGQGNTWNGKKLTLQLDHINGKRTDNRLKNLRILCPNCHTQTPTHGSKRGFSI